MRGAVVQGGAAVLAAVIGGLFTIWVAREGKLDVVIGAAPTVTTTVTATVTSTSVIPMTVASGSRQSSGADGGPGGSTAGSPSNAAAAARRVYRSGHAALNQDGRADLDTAPGRPLLSGEDGREVWWYRMSDSTLMINAQARRLDDDHGPLDPARCPALDGYAKGWFPMKESGLQAGDRFCVLTTGGRFAMISLTTVTQLNLEFDYVVQAKDGDG